MIVVAFPGQGAQKVGMAENLTQNQLHYFHKASSVLGYDLLKLCNQGPLEKLSLTQYTQPALMVSCISLWSELKRITNVQVLAGHSLGEITALIASGAVDFLDGVKITAKRGELMSRHSQGGMAAIIGLDAAQVKKIVEESKYLGIISIANYNAPGQFVISGESNAVKSAARLALAVGAKKVVPLRVSGSFHSSLMQPVGTEFLAYLNQFKFKDPKYPVISNINSHLITTAGQIKNELGRQLTTSVQWIENVLQLKSLGMTEFIEVSSVSVLAGLTRQITADIKIVSYP